MKPYGWTPTSLRRTWCGDGEKDSVYKHPRAEEKRFAGLVIQEQLAHPMIGRNECADGLCEACNRADDSD